MESGDDGGGIGAVLEDGDAGDGVELPALVGEPLQARAPESDGVARRPLERAEGRLELVRATASERTGSAAAP